MEDICDSLNVCFPKIVMIICSRDAMKRRSMKRKMQYIKRKCNEETMQLGLILNKMQ